MEPLYQKIEINESRLFIIKNTECNFFDGLFHFHPEYELILIVNGQGSCLLGNRLINYTSGDLFFFGPNLPHSWRSDTSFDGKSQSLVVQLNRELWSGSFFNGMETKKINQLFKNSIKGIKIIGNTKDTIVSEMVLLEKKELFHQLLQLLKILNTLSKSNDIQYINSSSIKNTLNSKDSDKINKVYQFVYKNYRNSFELKEVATEVNMSTSAFCRYFKKITRKTFSVFLNEYRVGQAQELLITSDLNITQICYESGFFSSSHFNNQFKKITGFSPIKYRKKLVVS